ncbi:MAG TPA: mechanosensitive ion channel domain-containing protein [Dissulfurispiraceae bacterium]
MAKLIESLNIASSPYVNALISVLVFAGLAKIVDFFADKVVRRFMRIAKSEVGDRFVDIIRRPLFLTIILFGIGLAITYLRPAEKAALYIDALVYSVMTVIWMFAAVKVGNLIIENAVFKVSDVTGLGKDVVPLVENVLKLVVIVAGLMVILSLWRINIIPLIASAGIAGAAVALAAKDTIANFLGGISLFVDKPFKIGDYIVLDRGERGEVVAIGIRSTKVRTLDDIMITMPNSLIINTKIVNESAPTPYLRIRMPVGVEYGSDIDFVEKTLVSLALQNENVIKEPAPRAMFASFGDSTLNFELLCWIKEPALRAKTIDELNRGIYRKFSESGIKIKNVLVAEGSAYIVR